MPVTEEGISLSWAGDRIEAGEAVSVSDTISGDAMLAGGEVRFSGSAAGSFLGAGGSQVIGGRVASSVRAAGGEVRLEGRVGQNATLAGGSVRLEEDATVERNAYLAGGSVEVRGRVRGSVRVAGGEVVLDGPVGGNVHVEAGRLRVGPDARIDGDLRYRTDEARASIDPAAVISGTVEALPSSAPEGGGGGTFFRVLRILAFVVSGVVVVSLFPRTTGRLVDVVRDRSLISLGVGLLVLVVVPMAVGILALTILGVPLALIVLVLFGVALYLGGIPAALWLGRAILPWRPENLRASRAADFAVGGVVLAVVGFVPLVGFLLRLVFTLAGLGAAALLIRDGA